ncbi:GNAT family acetyltransferase [Peptoniphilus sp. BV3AC2]|uniref:GNAT family acetyltransferase n=1 Tax=Peptoniphilus sp. BV3AC2 TaxID=1111133 RepID=UPI0003B804F9|nr:GNAT family acetyltransferase [Peptoniphilus sp. BV3AC2]ERT64868.1 acetyltransferase (GNAT) domain protein [Peptoniphilus sp. BV3AC2]
MKIELAKKTDLDKLLEIYREAREFMKNSGNKTQWGDNKPSKETLERDIENKNLYKVVDFDEIVGAFALIYGEDKTYLEIDGKWLNDEPYATLHRVASSGKARGIMSEIIKFSEEKFENLRIDTHKNNHKMLDKIRENGFTYCGVIKIDDGSPREAFQKISKK